MINWFFVWSSKRPPIWESTLMNMNQSLASTDYMSWNGLDWIPPANWREVPDKFITPAHKKNLKGQMLDQFENESFKFVIEKNESQYNVEDKIIIYRHLTPQFGLNETNSRTINLDKIYKYFDNYQWVALGLFFANVNQEIPGGANPNSLPEATWYGRNHNNKIVNLETGEILPEWDYLTVATYVNFRMLRDKNYVVCTLNPHLVAVPHTDDFIIDNKHRFMSLDTFDSTLNDNVIKPKIENGVEVNNTIFVKQGEKFSINIGEESLMWLKYTELADFPVTVETNLTYTKSKNKISFIMDRPVGYAKIKINTGSLSDKYNNKDTAGITALQYVIVGEENGS